MASTNGDAIQLNDYERFVNALKQMRLEILTTKHELEDAIYNLDPLTGAASRVGMLTKLREQQALVQRKVQFCCLAMMDIDHFKRVNDGYGHAVGDRVLAALSHQLKSEMRPYDVIFRYGGEEFLVCMPAMEIKTGYAATDRLRQSVAGMQFESDGGEPFRVTVSFGLTLLDADVSGGDIDRAGRKGALCSKGRRTRSRYRLGSLDDLKSHAAPTLQEGTALRCDVRAAHL